MSASISLEGTNLEGRTAVVTGAGAGLGRAEVLALAGRGANVVVNDIGSAASDVVAEVEALGRKAVAVTGDVGDWNLGEQLVQAAVDTFGSLDVVVNNAGITRDTMLFNLTEQQWDDVIRVHLKGHFAPTRWAAAHWREESKAGREVEAAVINTSSTSGLLGNPGQANYGAAKAGIAAFTQICALELARYGVRCNAVVPVARTRLTEATPGLEEVVKRPDDSTAFDEWDPANVSPVVAYLATADCPANGRVLLAHGGKVQLFQPWSLSAQVEKAGRWTVRELEEEMSALIRP